MTRRFAVASFALPAVLAASLFAGSAQATPQIWSGRTFAFSKAANADPTLAVNQDLITPLVWITRGATQGIYNAQSETAYSHLLSPAGTTWATGDAVDYASLTFTSWEAWAGSNPPATVGLNAVVHLVAEDIYVDIRFDSWGAGLSGGAFSYHRAVDPGATPTEQGTWGALKALYR
jgi:hypothetical protein